MELPRRHPPPPFLLLLKVAENKERKPIEAVEGEWMPEKQSGKTEENLAR